MDVKAKLEERGRAVNQMRALQAKAKEEKRDFTSEEDAQFNTLDAAQEKLRSEVESYQKGLDRSAKLDKLENETRSTDTGIRPAPAPGAETRHFESPIDEVRASKEYGQAYAHFIRTGNFIPPSGSRASTLQVDSFTKGGALLAPIQYVEGILKGLDDEVFIREWATKHKMDEAQSLGVVTLDTDAEDADWSTELATVTDTDVSLGKRELHPHPLTKGVKMSNDLLRRKPSAEATVIDRLRYKFGITQEKAFMTGDGVRKPLGVFIASDDGIPSTRDVSTGNTATDIGGDGLIEAKHAVKAAYWRRLRWVFSRDALKRIRKIKDSVNGNYVWVPGLQAGVADRILDVPYVVSEYCPATFTSGLYVGIIGDFSNYWIADAFDMTIQRLVELSARQRKTEFIGALSCDGQPVLGEAFARVKLG